MTAVWIITGCIAFMLVTGVIRERAGVALADTALLVFLLGMIALADMILGRFLDTGAIGWTVAGLVASGFALDALYGLMAPQRQRRRDQKLRSMMRRRRA